MTKRRYEKQADPANNQPKVTVLWDSELCVHCGACYQGLPQVFKPDDRPWVDLDGAPATDIIEQVRKCPSNALSIEEE